MAIYANKDLYGAVLELKVVEKRELDDALSLATKSSRLLGEILVEKDLVDDDNIAKLIADVAKVPYINLSDVVISPEVLNVIPEEVARQQSAIVFKLSDKQASLATSNLENEQFVDFVRKKTHVPVKVYFASENDLERAFDLFAKDVTKVFDRIIKESIEEAAGKKETDPPIIKIVDTVISYAYQNNASDVHIEPLEEWSLVRFRVDGILKDIVELPLNIHPKIISRIKVLASLRTDEHMAAQDGKISYKVRKDDLDIRVSIVPITNGEKVVMRLLSERARRFSLADLGIHGEDLKKVENAYSKPHGMILATGPTGSGKTTSLYGILKILNEREVNIMTIEDPVEYDVDNVNQIQVNEKAELTFAKGLRSIVRQDPDIILVGEIRDEETADIAVNASMTGHLVLSSLHTNDSATAFPRLLDLGVESYLVASTVNVVVAQRLVRKIHNRCRVSVDLPIDTLKNNFDQKTVKKYFPQKTKARVYKGKGCNVCYGTGYYGRVGIFEVLFVDDDIREAITDRRDAPSIEKLAISKGMTKMIEDGLRKVSEGETTMEEVLRVTKE